MVDRSWWVVALLATTVLAGCTDDAGDALEVEDVEVAPGIVVAADKGAARIQVKDSAGLALEGARVQLIGTQHFGNTDPEGRIAFVNITAGEHTLRVERTGFAVHEEPLQINASALVTAEVFLLPTTSGGFRPHVHDLWGGSTQHIMFDGPFDYTTSSSDSDVVFGPVDPLIRSTVHANRNESTSLALVPVPEQVDGGPNLVFPGAASIDVTVSWDTDDSTLERVGVAVAEPDDSKPKYFARKASGSTWTIPVGPDGFGLSDVGHQRYTFWDFYLYPGNNFGQPTQWTPGLVTGPFQVTITVHKGDMVPVEPEHRDFWGKRTKQVLMDTTEPALEDPSNPTGDRYRNKGHIFLDHGTLVPPGTDRLTINHTWVYRTGHGEAGGTALDMPYVLTWRTADQHKHTTTLDEYRRTPGAPCGDHCVQYDFELEPGWEDAFYQTRSLWAFLPSVEGYEDEVEYRPDPRPKDHYLEIIAWRD